VELLELFLDYAKHSDEVDQEYELIIALLAPTDSTDVENMDIVSTIADLDTIVDGNNMEKTSSMADEQNMELANGTLDDYGPIPDQGRENTDLFYRTLGILSDFMASQGSK